MCVHEVNQISVSTGQAAVAAADDHNQLLPSLRIGAPTQA